MTKSTSTAMFADGGCGENSGSAAAAAATTAYAPSIENLTAVNDTPSSALSTTTEKQYRVPRKGYNKNKANNEQKNQTATEATTTSQMYGETAMNMSLLDPARYGWTACGGIANVLSDKHVYTKHPPKLSLMVTVEFPLERSTATSGRTMSASSSPKKRVAMFRDTIPWDLSDPQTPSPLVFATSISEEFGLDFDQTMDLALRVERQIEAHVTQHCQYAEPVTLKDPHHDEVRDHLGPIVQPYRYDPVIVVVPSLGLDGGEFGSSGKEGILKPGYSTSNSSRKCFDSSSSLNSSRHQPKSVLMTSQPSSSSVGGRSSRNESSNNKKAMPQKQVKVMIGDVIPVVEPEYVDEVKKRLLEASISDTRQRHHHQQIAVADGETTQHRLELVKDIQCHICHKKRPVVYMFGCGLRKHMYCHYHIESRISTKIETDKNGNWCLDECPVCTLQCECSLCTRKLNIVSTAFKASCKAQRAPPAVANFPSVLLRSQSTELSDFIREIQMTPVLSNVADTDKEKTSSKLDKPPRKRSSPEKAQTEGITSRRIVPQPALVDFPQEFLKGVDLELQVPEWRNVFFTVFSSTGQTLVNTLPEAWVRPRTSGRCVLSASDEVISDDYGNVSYCHSCRLPGNLVCCDICPRAFHRQCLDEMANPPVNAGLSNADAAQWECPLCPQERFGFDHDAVDGKAYLHEIVTAFNNPPNGSAEIHTCAKEVLSMILEMIEKLIQYDFGTVFAQPVIPNEVKGYGQIIEAPMDLGTILSSIRNSSYSLMRESGHSIDDVILSILKDIHLCFHNCLLLNRQETAVARMANVLLQRAAAIQAKSFDHLLSPEVKVKLSTYKKKCSRTRQRFSRPGGMQLKKGVSKEDAMKMFKPSSADTPIACPGNAIKLTMNKHVALLDPVDGRVVKIYIFLSHAMLAVQLMRSKGHPSEDNNRRITYKHMERGAKDPFFLIYGYRWVFLDDLVSGKVQFQSPPSRDLSNCAVVKRDLITGKTLNGFDDLESAYCDWKRSFLSSPTRRVHDDESLLTKESFETDYLVGNQDVDGVVWESPTSPDESSLKGQGPTREIADPILEKSQSELEIEQEQESVTPGGAIDTSLIDADDDGEAMSYDEERSRKRKRNSEEDNASDE